MFDKNVKVIKAIKFAGNYLENGDIVKITFRDGETEIGELQIDELDSVMIKTINNRCIFHDLNLMRISLLLKRQV